MPDGLWWLDPGKSNLPQAVRQNYRDLANPPVRVLGLRVLRTPNQAATVWLLENVPKEAAIRQPYVAPSTRAFHAMALGLVSGVASAHAHGYRLNLSASTDAPADMVQLIRTYFDQNNEPVAVLAGGLGAWQSGGPEPAEARRLPACWPCRRTSWQAKLAESAGQAGPDARDDWRAVLRVLYYHRTALRLIGPAREGAALIAHAARARWQLVPGFKRWLATALSTPDGDVLHWGMGLRAGFRRWLRRLR